LSGVREIASSLRPISGGKNANHPVTGSPPHKHGGARPGSGRKPGTNKKNLKKQKVKKMGASKIKNYRTRAQAAKIRDEVTLVLFLFDILIIT
jgi:hypothetical protein